MHARGITNSGLGRVLQSMQSTLDLCSASALPAYFGRKYFTDSTPPLLRRTDLWDGCKSNFGMLESNSYLYNLFFHAINSPGRFQEGSPAEYAYGYTK